MLRPLILVPDPIGRRASCGSRGLRAGHRHARGAAVLAFVTLLFFTLSMVSLYTHRQLVLEQRTAAHQVRAAQAHEAAEAGLQWMLARLNGARVDAQCRPSEAEDAPVFRLTRLRVDDDNGQFVPLRTGQGQPLAVECVHDELGWQCACPADALPEQAGPATEAPWPAFRARLVEVADSPGLVGVEVVGCTRASPGCLAFNGTADELEGRATLSALLAFKPTLATAPAAALTARGDVLLSEGAPQLVHADAAIGGWTVHAGGIVQVPAGALHGPAGTPGELSVAAGDRHLSGPPADALFQGTFGLPRPVFQALPTTRHLDCTSSACSAEAVRTAAARHPGHALWLQGDLVIDDPQELGSPAQPLLLIVSGQVRFEAPARLYGLLYVRAAGWMADGAAEVHGAVMAEGAVAGRLRARLARDDTVLQALRRTHGNFALVPGSWEDLP